MVKTAPHDTTCTVHSNVTRLGVPQVRNISHRVFFLWHILFRGIYCFLWDVWGTLDVLDLPATTHKILYYTKRRIYICITIMQRVLLLSVNRKCTLVFLSPLRATHTHAVWWYTALLESIKRMIRPGCTKNTIFFFFFDRLFQRYDTIYKCHKSPATRGVYAVITRKYSALLLCPSAFTRVTHDVDTAEQQRAHVAEPRRVQRIHRFTFFPFRFLLPRLTFLHCNIIKLCNE